MTATRFIQTARALVARLGEAFSQRRIARDLDDELRTHLELEVEHNVARGMTEAEARRQALLAFGGVQRFREETRDARGFAVLERIAQDVRFAVRRLRRTPAFTVGVVATLGVGFGTAVGLGVLTDTVLLRPLPYADSDRIVRIDVETPGLGTTTTDNSRGTFSLFAERLRSTTMLGGYYENDGIAVSIGVGDVPERTIAAMVTPSIFRILETHPALGRLFADADAIGDSVPVLISFDLWQRRFGGDSGAIGQTIEINRGRRRVIGVLPEGFDFPSRSVSVWFPEAIRATTAGLSDRYFTVIGRLRNGVSVRTANAEATSVASRIGDRFPELKAGAVADSRLRVAVRTLRSAIVAPVRGELVMLAALAATVLLIALTNVTTLVMLRSETVRGEIAVSQALGASESAIARRLVVEAVVLSTGGGVAGLPIAVAAITTKLGFGSDQVPRLHEVRVGGATIAAMVAMTIVAGVALGLVAVLRTRRALAEGALSGQAARMTRGVAWRRSRQGLVIVQVAMALSLLLGSGLMAKSLVRLRQVDLGFVAGGGTTFSTPLPFSSYETYQKSAAFHLRVLSRLRSLPGVTDAAAVMRLPLAPGYASGELRIETSSASRTSQAAASGNVATPNYFHLMGIPFRAGRSFQRGDIVATNPAIILSASLARSLFGDADPLGREVKVVGSKFAPYRVVGIVGDVYGERIVDGPLRTLYFPFLDDLPAGSPEGPRIPFNASAHYVVRGATPLIALCSPSGA